MMIIINNYIVNNNKNLKYNIKINMMIQQIMIKDHYLWIHNHQIHKVNKNKKNILLKIKIIKKIIS